MFDGEEYETVWILLQEELERKECVGCSDGRGRLEWGSFATESLPIVAVVMEEVSDFTEDFKRDCVSEWHGDGWLDDVGGVCCVDWM
jgi:hypothetical protein